MNDRALLARIQDAFPIAPMPAMTMRQAQLADEGLARAISEEELRAVREIDGGVSWVDISDESLLECEASLSHFDAESFVYYLPAFLRFAIQNVEVGVLGRKGDLMNSIVFAVTNLSSYNLERLQHLRSAQNECVVDFLRFLSERSSTYRQDADEALKHYWLTTGVVSADHCLPR
jgi:hypothetical protein